MLSYLSNYFFQTILHKQYQVNNTTVSYIEAYQKFR